MNLRFFILLITFSAGCIGDEIPADTLIHLKKAMPNTEFTSPAIGDLNEDGAPDIAVFASESHEREGKWCIAVF